MPKWNINKKMDYPKVSIVVIARNEERVLSLCLDALMQLDYPKNQIEIIVVDNASTDKTKDIIKSYPVLYVFEGKKGRGVARNSGIRASSGTLIGFIDADCTVCRDWLKNMVKGFESADIGGCGGAIALHKTQTLLDKYTSYILCVQQQAIEGDAFFLPFIMTANSIFRREAFDKINIFAQAIYLGEDIDISWRLILKGYRFNYIPDAMSWHRHRTNIISFCERIFRYGTTQSLLLKRYSGILRTKQFFNPSLPQLKSIKIMELLILLLIRLFHFAGEIYGGILSMFMKKVDLSAFLTSRKVIWWKKNDLISLFKLSTGVYYVLEGVGAKVYELLAKGGEPEEIIGLIADEYEVNAGEAKEDFMRLIEELRHNGIVW